MEHDQATSGQIWEESLGAKGPIVFDDEGTGSWEEKWFLDGVMGQVITSREGMELRAGPKVGDDAHHMVLWSRQSFRGDLRIDFDYVRLDHEMLSVNILYVLASGAGDSGHAHDILQWQETRVVPAMAQYFNNMNVYHISFAAFEMTNTDPAADYVRARRYRPDLHTGLKNTELLPDYFRTGLFVPGVKHHITVIKRGDDLLMQVTNPGMTKRFHWNTQNQPPISEGRIGIRHMYGRSARYTNISVRQLNLAKPSPLSR